MVMAPAPISNHDETTCGDIEPQRRLTEGALDPVDDMRASLRNKVSVSFEATGSGGTITLLHGIGSN